MATAVCDALWGSIPIITFMTTSLVVVGHHGGTPACRLFVLDPLLSHSVGEARAGGASYESQSVHTDGRHFVSYPARTSERYGLTTTSADILKQALRGVDNNLPRATGTLPRKGPGHRAKGLSFE